MTDLAWLIIGIVLVVLEIVLPAGYLLWMGASALIVSALLWLFPGMPLLLQLLIFGALAISSLLLYLKFWRTRMTDTDQPSLNRRGEQYIGRILSLSEAIEDGVGKVHVDDTTWIVHGNDAPQGSRVKITAVQGTALKSTPA